MVLEAKIAKEAVELSLRKRSGLSHIKVRTRGDIVTLESVDEEGIKYPHARFKRRTVHIWCLQMPTKRNWEPIFIEGTLSQLVDVLVDKFPWALRPVQ
jgi:hypothetical protein